MSLRAMTWALEQAPVDDPAQLLVLWALSDRAHDDGTAAWPTQQWIAERARCSGRSVRRYLKALEAAGVIVRGDQELVAHLPRDKRPVVWDLVLTATAAGQSDRPASSSGRTPGAERPDRAGHSDRTLLSTEPSFTPYGSETVLEPSGARKRATRLPEDFAVTDAMKAWAAAEAPHCNRRDHDEFCDYWRALPGQRGTKLDWVATWRNAMRRASDRRGSGIRPGRPMPAERLASALEIGRQLQEAAERPALRAVEGTGR